MDGFWCASHNCPEHLGYGTEVKCCDVPTKLLSPNYPESYKMFYTDPPTWLITADIGTIINVQFHSFHVCLLSILLVSKFRQKIFSHLCDFLYKLGFSDKHKNFLDI